MAEVILDSIPAKLRDLYNKGFLAMERGNLPYAIDLFTSCLEQEPRLLSARKFLRMAEIKQVKGAKPSKLSSIISSASNLPTLLKASSQIKSGKALQAVGTLEGLLRKDPLNMSLIKAFVEAAEAADMPEAAIQTLVIAREYYSQDIELLNQLGEMYMKTNQTRLGRECFESVVVLRPNDGAALKRLKDAMAIDSMAKDGWSDASKDRDGYRRLIKDERQATILEQEAKAGKAGADGDALLKEYEDRVRKEPENINYRRALANMYSSLNRFDEAITILEEAQKIAVGRDPMVDNTISTTRVQKFNFEIEKLRKAGDSAGAEAKSVERDTFIFEDLKSRVMRYPNDMQLRFEFGVMLSAHGLVNDAIQQFQMAQRSPQYRARSYYHIGVCFAEKKQYDMAVDQLDKAIKDMLELDDQKKAAIYELGRVYEASGDMAKATECYKQIYQVDIAYRDVTAKIEKGYSGGSPQ